MLAILDYKAGNQTSVQRALTHLGVDSRITADAAVIAQADGVLFPGVGAAGQAMRHLCDTGLDAVLRGVVARETPLLGICLGCQILLQESEENATPTLGLVPGVCRRFDPTLTEEDGTPLRIPHMGWNGIRPRHIGGRPSPLLEGLPPQASYYFVHSYYVCPDEDLVLATCTYGQEFCAVYGREGLWAVQFHPEKSGEPGLRLLGNFARYCEARRAQ